MSKISEAVGEVNTSEHVMVLTAHDGKLLTKTIYRQEDGTLALRDYDRAYEFRMEHVPVGSLADLRRILESLAPNQCIVYGRIIPGTDTSRALRRHQHRDGEPATLEDAPHRWLALDAETLLPTDDNGKFDYTAEPERAAKLAISRLPFELHDHDCIWQLTSSAGLKPDVRLRLFFWLDRPLTGAEAKAWLCANLIDPTAGTETRSEFSTVRSTRQTSRSMRPSRCWTTA